MSHIKKSGPSQLELPLQREPEKPDSRQGKLEEVRPALRVIKGEGRKKKEPRLVSRDAVVRVLLEAGGDLLLRRISPERAEEIRRAVDKIMVLFDRVDASPQLMPTLQRQLDRLETLMRQTRATRAHKGR